MEQELCPMRITHLRHVRTAGLFYYRKPKTSSSDKLFSCIISRKLRKVMLVARMTVSRSFWWPQDWHLTLSVLFIHQWANNKIVHPDLFYYISSNWGPGKYNLNGNERTMCFSNVYIFLPAFFILTQLLIFYRQYRSNDGCPSLKILPSWIKIRSKLTEDICLCFFWTNSSSQHDILLDVCQRWENISGRGY